MRLLFLLVILLITLRVVTGASFPVSSAPALYTADATTRLFDNFDGATLADSRSASATFAPGYIEGQALFLSDTGAHAVFSDSWLVESGTIEFYYRPETYIFTGAKPHGMLLTIGERPNPPGTGGLPQLSIFEQGFPIWAISANALNYDEASANEPLNPEQWYHIAVTAADSQIRLYVNDTLVASSSSNFNITVDTFLIGATGRIATSQGLAARGRIDRLRISRKIRVAGEFPTALDVRITSPVGNDTVAQPFNLAYVAYASDTRPRVVDIYRDTDEFNFNGTLIASDLPESGTVSIRFLPDTYHFFYAVARAGNDAAYFRIADRVRVLEDTAPRTFTIGQTGGGGCLLTRFNLDFDWARDLRDAMIATRLGRLATKIYYAIP